MPEVEQSDWTNAFSEWHAVDNRDGTCTWTRDAGDGSGTASVFASLSEGARSLVKRLVLGNVTKGGGRTACTTTSKTFSKSLTLQQAALTYLHSQPARGMSN